MLIGIIAVIVFAGLFFLSWFTNHNRIQHKGKSGDIARNGPMLERVTGIPEEWKIRTASGLQIWQDPGVVITGPEITLIEAGIKDCITKARAYAQSKGLTWTKALDLSEYIVASLKSQRAAESGTWSFEVPDMGGKYNDTVFDQAGNYILANECIANYGGRWGNIMCLPDAHGATDDKDREALYNGAMYGAEHIILFHNDPEFYKATEVHLTGGHPLF